MKWIRRANRRSGSRGRSAKSVFHRWRITRVQQTEDSPMELAPQGSFLELYISAPGRLALGNRRIEVKTVVHSPQNPSRAEILCYDPGDHEIEAGMGEVTCHESTVSGEITWRDGSLLQFWGVRRVRKRYGSRVIPVAGGSSGCNGWALAVPFLKNTR